MHAGARWRPAGPRFAAALLCALLLPGWALAVRAAPAVPPPPPPLPDAIEEVTITGERPGPGLWKISRDGHTLWLLGTLETLPKRMSWHSAQVDTVIAHSQLVIPASASVKADAGPFALVGLYFNWRRTEHLPDKQRLSDVVPGPLFQRFESLRRRYAPHETMDTLRPMIAAQQLFRKALSESGLRNGREVEQAVLDKAHARRVRVQENLVRIADPKGLLAELREIPVQAELSCFEVTLARLEHDLPALRERAAAWSVGNVEALRTLRSAQERGACWDAIELSPRLHAMVEAERSRRILVAQQALAEHASTLALVPIDELLAPEGVLALFQRQGYTVEGP
jgi:uncharacterized protein YbaP (TraB family)